MPLPTRVTAKEMLITSNRSRLTIDFLTNADYTLNIVCISLALMTTPLQIKAQIAQIKASGKVAEPHTWISATSVTKNGKKYTYYRLLKGNRVNSGEDGEKLQKTKLKTKMVSYLGTADSEAYKEMQQAIPQG